MDIMFDAMQSCALRYRREFISVPPDVPETPPARAVQRGRRCESLEHKAMKRWVRAHLLHGGYHPAADELSALGYRVDVGSLKEGIYVECGDTEPRKVLEFLRNDLNIGILQYNSEEILWFVTSQVFKEMAALE